MCWLSTGTWRAQLGLKLLDSHARFSSWGPHSAQAAVARAGVWLHRWEGSGPRLRLTGSVAGLSVL